MVSCTSNVWDSVGLPGNVVFVLFSWRNWLGKFGSDIWNMVLACLEVEE